jgi:CBS domain-containing protein
MRHPGSGSGSSSGSGGVDPSFGAAWPYDRRALSPDDPSVPATVPSARRSPEMVRTDESLRVADFMSLDPVTVPLDATVEEAEALMRDRHVTGLPVVDADGHLVGVISQTDIVFLEASSVRSFIHRPHPRISVGEVMSTPPITIDGSAPLIDAADRMTREGIHRLVVVDDRGRPAGVIAAMDFVALAAEG